MESPGVSDMIEWLIIVDVLMVIEHIFFTLLFSLSLSLHDSLSMLHGIISMMGGEKPSTLLSFYLNQVGIIVVM